MTGWVPFAQQETDSRVAEGQMKDVGEHYAAVELAQLFPLQVFQEKDEEYKAVQNSYWSGCQKDLRPRCFFQPHNAAEVAKALSLCAKANVAFGVKSGGHGHFAGQSCLDGGIQFDLAKLNSITINREKGTALVGTGSTWRAVYTKLQKENLMAIGGRSADVGLGGFLIGGGISFYAAERGWGINNVRSIEIVLASGKVITASEDSNPTLFRALQGGGANFGIITTYELITIPYSGMWGGRTILNGKYSDDAIQAWCDFQFRLDEDPTGHSIIILTWENGFFQIMQYIVSTKPIADRPMFDQLRSIPVDEYPIPLKMLDYTDLASDIADLQGDHGFRVGCATLTVGLDVDFLKWVLVVFEEEMKSLWEFARGTMEYHCLPRTFEQTGNVYPFQAGHRKWLVLMLGVGWMGQENSEKVYSAQKRLVGRIRAEAIERGLYHPFLFANYAAHWQDVIGSYGPQNVKFLTQVSEEYDPDQVFQRLHQGSYKIKSPTLPGVESEPHL
ncbi:hypothetical protein LTR84_003952 [Exophiala bonariae]|uniref:FAD-binding PCMH-type domain-containing protein n=1 Tax=Exophiala bonariae TaxID=1690606 RepID=A0AAV9N745_9EURO|nr:hypothetical protein LTR84_003952 [Exophiala bonariae]